MALRNVSKLLFLCCLLAPMIAFGQASMSSSGSGSWGTPTVISNFPDVLVGGGGVNAWHNLKFSAVSVSSDNGATYAVDSSCNGYLYSDSTRTFTKHTEWGCVAQLHKAGDGNLYAIHRHTSGGYYLGRWGGSSWTDLSCCFIGFAVSPGASGVMVAHDVNGTIWLSTNYGTTFATKPFCNAISEAVDVLDSSGNPSFEVVCSNDTFVKYTNSTWGSLPGNGVLISHGRGSLYMVGTLGKANHWNGTNWDAIVSNTPITSIAAGNGVVFSVTGGNVYALSEQGMEFTRSYSGTVGCNPGVPPSECQTFHHTSQGQICITEHCGAVVNGVPFNGNGQWGLTAKVHANDMFNCFDVAEDCVPSEPTGSTNMECSGGGTNTDQPSNQPVRWETASTRVKVTPGAPYWNPAYERFYYSNITTECSNTASPDLNPNGVPGFKVSDTDAHDVTMDISSFGISFNGGPWFWFALGVDGSLDASPGREFDPGPAYCNVYPN